MEINLKNKKNLTNINKLFNGRNDATKFVDDYGSTILEAKRKPAQQEPEPEPEPSTKLHQMHQKLNAKNFLYNCVKNL